MGIKKMSSFVVCSIEINAIKFIFDIQLIPCLGCIQAKWIILADILR